MGMPDALSARALGAACLGVAVFEYPCSVRALRRRSGRTAQEDNRLGTAGAPPRQALVARTGDRGRGRFRLCKPPAPGKLPALLAQAGDVHFTPLRLDAALYDPAPPRRAGQIGRPRLKGERLPNLSLVAEDPSTVWAPATVEDWCGSAERTVEVASATAVWYSTGLPTVPIRWVLVRDPQGEFATQALLCTD